MPFVWKPAFFRWFKGLHNGQHIKKDNSVNNNDADNNKSSVTSLVFCQTVVNLPFMPLCIIPSSNCRLTISDYLPEKSHLAWINRHISVTPLFHQRPQSPQPPRLNMSHRPAVLSGGMIPSAHHISTCASLYHVYCYTLTSFTIREDAHNL